MGNQILEEGGKGARVAFYLKRTEQERFHRILEERSKSRLMVGGKRLTQSEFLAMMVAVLSDSEIEIIEQRYAALEQLEGELHMRASREMLRMCAGKPPSTIMKMVEAVRKGQE